MKNDAGYLAVDPVCGMKVNPAEAAASLEFEGKTYHFCSAACHRKFSANPAAFLQSPAGEQPAPHSQAAMTVPATTGKQLAKDPICGMMVDKATAKT